MTSQTTTPADEPCLVCEAGPEECGCHDDDPDCMACGGSGYAIPEHCCDCGGSPYCWSCRKCGATCQGPCRCPVSITLQDGRRLDLPLPESETR